MRFETSTGLSTAIERIALRTGTRSSSTTFTSTLKTVKISSEHFGVQNEALVAAGLALRYVPHGLGTLTISDEFDRQGTESHVVANNPFIYGVIQATAAASSFILADDQNDTTASDMPDPDDLYTNHDVISGMGKEFEVTVTTSDEAPMEIVGIELEMTRGGKHEAYLGDQF